MKKRIPDWWWTLSFLGGALDGKTERYPYCPPDYAHKPSKDRYTLLERQPESRTAVMVRQCKTSSESL